MENQFLRNEMLWGQDAQRRLAASHVILFGLGGVGSYTAECLARSGIGELTLVDQDTVGLSNLNRQLEALHSTLGQAKAEAVAARLLDINPQLQVHPLCATYDAAHRDAFFPDGCRYDYIVDAIDLVSCKLDLAETALRLQIPMVMALGTGNKLDPTLLQLTDLSKTYGCPLARVMRKELRNRASACGVQPGGAHPRPGCTAGRRGPAAGSAEYPRQQSLGPRHRRTAAGQCRGAGPHRERTCLTCSPAPLSIPWPFWPALPWVC